MATEVASLYASIGADTKDLKKGLTEAGRLLGNTSKQMEQIGTATGDADGSTKGLGISLTQLGTIAGVVAGSVTAFGLAAKQAFDFSEQGASVIQTGLSFDRLGVSIETMHAASLGTVDDMTLMGSTLTLVAGAGEELQARMLQSAPQLMEIAKAANAVNPALGTTSFMYDSIARGVKRASPLILDNLGIIVKIGEANEQYAAAIGKTVEELSAEDKQIALLNATLASGNRLIEQAGGSTAAYGDAWAAVRGEIKNTTDDMKAQAAEGLGPLIGRYAELLRTTRENGQALIGIGAGWRMLTDVILDVGGAVEGIDYDRAYGGLARWNDELEESSKITEHTAGAQKDYNKILKGGISILEQTRLQGQKTNTLVSSLSESTLGSAEAWDRYVISLGDAAKGTDEYRQQLMDADFQMRELERNTKALELVADIKWATGQTLTEDLEDFGTQLSGLRDKASKLRSKIGELEGMSYRTSAQDEELNGLRGQLGDVRGDIDNVIAGMREMSARFVLGLIEMQINADQKMTPVEAAFYAGYAHQMGLIDDLALEQSALIAGIVENMNLYGMTAEEALIAVLGQTDNLVGGFMKVGTAGVGSLSDIIAKGDVTIGKLMDVGLSAVAAQALIDQMHGKDIDINVKFNIPALRLPGGETIETPTGDYAYASGGTIPMGGWGLVGEEGAELAQAGPGGTLITPLSGGPAPMGMGSMSAPTAPLSGGAGGSRIGSTWSGDINIYGVTDPDAVMRRVMRGLQDRGMISAGSAR